MLFEYKYEKEHGFGTDKGMKVLNSLELKNVRHTKGMSVFKADNLNGTITVTCRSLYHSTRKHNSPLETLGECKSWKSDKAWSREMTPWLYN